MRRSAQRSVTICIMLFGPAIMSCDDSATNPQSDAVLSVLLTDAPSDYIGEAFVDIGEVVLVRGGDSPLITLSEDGTDGEVDLLTLQDMATVTLAEGVVEPGTYQELRLIVESARVVLAPLDPEGDPEIRYEFNEGGSERDLFVPSGAETGIKLKLAQADQDGENGGVVITPGETVLVLDFDVNQSFVIQGDPETPAGINSVLFTPTIRVAVQDVAGSISGVVSTTVPDLSVEGLVVTAEPVLDEGESGEYQTLSAGTTTGADGSYSIPFLVPGTYTVSVTPPEGHVSEPANIEVEVAPEEVVPGVNFTITPATGP